MDLNDARAAVLRAAADRIIPADEFPAAWEAGVGDYVARLLDTDLRGEADEWLRCLDALDAEAVAAEGVHFVELSPPRQDELLSRVEAGDVRSAWPRPAAAFFKSLVSLTAEGYYGDPGNGGNRGGVSWAMIGYDTGAAACRRPFSRRMTFTRRMTFSRRMTFTRRMTRPWISTSSSSVRAPAAGWRRACSPGPASGCCCWSAGRRLAFADVPRDHLRNHRLPLYGHNTGPDLDGNPRVFVDASGRESVVRPHDPAYQNNAAAVGGGTLVYGAQAWRYLPPDFRMASVYGVPEGSSLADWPLDYDDLEPYYDRAEWEVGVAGDSHAPCAPRRRGYPMPPVPDNPQRPLLRAAAERLGWHAFPAPLLVNSVPYNGRPACARCGQCIGFACGVDAKNGTQNTLIPRALATGNCELAAGATAERIDTDGRGVVVGVTYVQTGGGEPRRVTVRAGTVVVAAGAIETARLLLNSKSAAHPRGLGNPFDQVGRHLQGHYYPGAFGRFEQPVNTCEGPGVTIATCQFNHGNPGVVGGGMMANEFVRLPIIFWRNCFPPGARTWGADAKRYMRENYLRVMQVQGPVQEIPSPHSRVTVDDRVRDRWGIPVARLSGTTHPQTLRTADFMRGKCRQWLEAAGAKEVWSWPQEVKLSAGQHQAGTCRMGDDPKTSVTDSRGRVHGHENLFVADASLHVTNGGFNPVLTIMALAYRVAEEAKKK